jgi:hypothetical protein
MALILLYFCLLAGLINPSLSDASAAVGLGFVLASHLSHCSVETTRFYLPTLLSSGYTGARQLLAGMHF